MNLVRRRGLPTLAGLALTAGILAVPSPARADGENTAPTATYALDSTAVWAGQRVTLTESAFADDSTPSENVTRTISWGDGSPEVRATGSGPWSHTFTGTGSDHVTVTLDDNTGVGTSSGPGTFAGGSTVGVTTPPGSFAWQPSTIYTYPGYQAEGTLVGSGLPANADQNWLRWGDGETTLLNRTTYGGSHAAHWFPTGSHNPQVTMQNEQGKATARSTSSLLVAPDTTPPWAAVTIPASPTKAASWKVVRGTAGDSQSGADFVSMQIWIYNAKADYYYDFDSRKFVKYTTAAAVSDGVEYRAPVVANHWNGPSVAVPKGYYFEVWYWVADKAGNTFPAGSDMYHTHWYLGS
jgi:hypothetical protein